MLKIPGTDNNVYSVPSWSEFRAWIRNVAIAFVLLAIGASFGIYFYGQRSQHSIISNINTLAAKSCLASIEKHSLLNKYNDLVQSLVDSRTAVLNADIVKGDTASVKRDQAALKKYASDSATIPTVASCQIPLLKE